MKKLIAVALLSAFVALPVSANQATKSFAPIDQQCQWIDGYYRKDGTYVQGHYRGC